MIYVDYFKFPNAEEEIDFLLSERDPRMKRTCYDTFYPFKVLSRHGLERIDFEPITILYGGNGSGKSTALNVIAEKTKIKRDSAFNKSNFYPDYVKMCKMDWRDEIPENSRIITSDDVFDYMLNIRCLNEDIDNKREEIITEYKEYLEVDEWKKFKLRSLADFEQLRKIYKARRKSQSRIVREELMDNVRGYSNGESAFIYFTEKIDENGLYILDEPENSLSPKRQTDLARFIEDSARFFKCQIIISTHSPFLLALRGAKIYDLDEDPVTVKRWTELENIRFYHEFFKSHKDEFL